MSPTSYHCSTPPVIVPAGGPDGGTAAPGGVVRAKVPARGVDNLTTAPFDALMSLFSSRRERRLWAWTLLVVVAIYSTLGLAWTLAGALRDSGLLDRSLPVLMFLMGMVLVGATIVTRGLKVRPGGVEVAVALGVATAYFMVFVRIAILEERSHLIEYSVVAGLIHEALTERASQGRRVPLPALLAFLAAALIGVLDEGIQAFLPSRVFDPQDMLFNVLAAAMAVAAGAALAWARRRTSRSRHRRSDQ